MTRPGAALVLIASLVLALGRPAPAAGEPRRRVALAVIVSARSQVTSISSRTLMALYLARPVDDLVALNLPVRSPERAAFDARILKMSGREVGLYWTDQAVRGERGAPRALPGASTVGKLVAKFPTAIGYLRADQVPTGVRVVRLDGKLPDDPDYPLWIEVER